MICPILNAGLTYFDLCRERDFLHVSSKQILFVKMAAELRSKIYGDSRPSFAPGFPSQLEAMQHYIYQVEEEYREKGTNRLYDKDPPRDRFVKNLREHWEKQQKENPKSVLDTVDVNKKVKPFIDFYWELKNKKAKLADQGWIDRERESLQSSMLDIEKKTLTKKRPIQEVII